MSDNRNERALWSGRPAMLPFILSPFTLACAALAGWLVWHGMRLGPVLRYDGIEAVTKANVFVVGGAILALAVLYLVLDRLLTSYELTNQRLILRKGILIRVLDEIELYRIRDVKLTRSIFQRLMALGSIHIDSTDGTGNITLVSVPGSPDVRERIRDVSESQRRSRSVVVG